MTQPNPSPRRFDLDWLRIAAFGLLIFYHIGMVYVTWEYHVKSRYASGAIEPLMLLVNPWRLLLLFLISGVAMRFMFDAKGPGRFLQARVTRLLPPLLLAIFVIVPPQSYVQIAQVLDHTPALPRSLLDDFYVRYLTGTGDWCHAGRCLTTPTFNHMWFVAYLLAYAAVLALIGRLLLRLPRLIACLIEGPGLFLVPWLYLFGLRVLLFDRLGETHDFVGDWYAHAIYLSAVLFGFAIARTDDLFERAERMRWTMLALTLGAWAVLTGIRAMLGEAEPSAALLAAMRGMREAQAWAAILAALGFFHRHFREADGPLRRTLSEAIFPCYLIHQTVIVVSAYLLERADWSLWAEVPTLIAVTVIGCWIFYRAGGAIGPLRMWIGLPTRARMSRKAL